MKKLTTLLWLLMGTMLLLSMTACSGGTTPAALLPKNENNQKDDIKKTSKASVNEEKLKVVYLANGLFGDKSFFDSANAGMKMIESELGVETKSIEMGYDETKWEPALSDVSNEDWDIIIVGSEQMGEILQRIAPEHPDKNYIIFDTSMNYASGDVSNVYSIMYKQNEGSFLAGVVAVKYLEAQNENLVLGFIGGMDIPVINDFMVGYVDGALYANKDAKCEISYIGSFEDSAKGKEQAITQLSQGVNLLFQAAAQAGLGAIDAVGEYDAVIIGVDQDQALIFEETEKVEKILTSVLKRIDDSLLRAVKLHIEGTLKYGETEYLGIREEAVGLAKNSYYEQNVPQEVQDYVDEVQTRILSSEIEVKTGMGMSADELETFKRAVKP